MKMTLLIEYDVLFSMVLTIIKSEVNAEIHGVKDRQNLVYLIFLVNLKAYTIVNTYAGKVIFHQLYDR